MRQVINVILILINIFFWNNRISTQKSFLYFQIYCFCSEMVTMVTTKYHSRISDVPNYSSIKFYVRIRSTNGNIRNYLLFNCAFIISDVTQSIVLYCKKSLKNNIFGFSVVFFSEKCLNLDIKS